MVNVPHIAWECSEPAGSVASLLFAGAETSTTIALPSAASRRIAAWPSCSSATAGGSGRFTATRQKRSYEPWLSAPGHQDTGRDLTIQGD